MVDPGNTGDNRTPTLSGDEPPLTQEEQLRALRAEVAALMAQVNAQSTQPSHVKQPNRAKAVRRPEPFKGTRNDKDNRTVETWFKSIERFISANGFTEEKDKIETAASFLEVGLAQREYETRIKEHGEFSTFKQFKDWLVSHYSPADPVNTFCDRLFHCKQQVGESFDDYFNRFHVANSLVDEPLPATYLVYLFIDNLQGKFKGQIRGDKEFSDYKNITLDDVLGKLKRTNFDNLPDDSVSVKSLHDRISSGNIDQSPPIKRRRFTASGNSGTNKP